MDWKKENLNDHGPSWGLWLAHCWFGQEQIHALCWFIYIFLCIDITSILCNALYIRNCSSKYSRKSGGSNCPFHGSWKIFGLDCRLLLDLEIDCICPDNSIYSDDSFNYLVS